MMRIRRGVLLGGLAFLLMPAAAAQAAFPGGNGEIAFGRSSNQQVDIWVVAPSVTGTRRITNTPHRTESMPDWNAAGTRIAYVRCVGTKLGNCDIFTMDADGGDRVRLTSTPDVQETWPSWSPDGTAMAFTSNAEDSFQDIWVMDDDGSNQTRLTTATAFDAFPEWSPDGNSIAFTSNRAAADDIWVMDADGGNPARLTSGRKIDERPDWAPDGTRMTFSRNGDIWIMDADGGNEVALTDTRQDEFASSFAPNGRRIAFNRLGNDGRIGVWVMRDDGTVRVQKTFGRIDFFPDWQPT